MIDDNTYAEILNKIKDDIYLFDGFCKKVPPSNPEQEKIYSDINCAIQESETDKRINKLLNNKSKFYKFGNDLSKIISSKRMHIGSKTMNHVIKFFINNGHRFYPYASRELIKEISPDITDEDTAIKILTAHSGHLDNKSCELLLNKINLGTDNPNLASVSKLKVFAGIKVARADLSIPEEKIKVLNIIAQRPTLIKYLKSQVNFTFEELKTLPPVRRFNFLEAMFSGMPRHSRFRTGTLKRVNAITSYVNGYWGNFRMDIIPEEQMNELLFSVVIQKNNRVVDLFENYKEFLGFVQAHKSHFNGILTIK